MPSVIEQSPRHGHSTAMNSVDDSIQTPISRAKAWEESWPYLFGVLGVVLYGTVGRQLPLSPGLKDMFIVAANTAGIFAAFFLASASILVTLQDSWFKRRAVESGVYTSLIGYMLTAMGWSIAVAVLTTGAILFEVTWHLWWYEYAIAGWVFIAVTTLGLSIRVLRIFSLLMKYVSAGQ